MGTQQTTVVNALTEFGHLTHFGVIIFDADHKSIYTNDEAKKLLGLEAKDENILSEVVTRVVPEDKGQLEKLMLTLRDYNSVSDIEFRLDGRSGQTFIRCYAYKMAGGELNMWMLEDITVSRLHERYLVEYGAKKNTLLDTLAHQLHGALQLMDHLTVAAKRITSDSEVRNYLDALQQNNAHCIATINNLLNEEHLRSPDISIKRTRINVLEVVFFIYQELKKSYPDRGLDFISTTGPIYIDSDEVKLLQVVNNLVSNAVKFTPPDKLVSIIIEDRDNAVVIEVRDEGIGIPDKLRPYIFDRFSRAGRTGLNGERSFGLGLSICKKLITLMNGMIWAHSEEGKGSSFFILVPHKSSLPTPDPLKG